MGGKKKKKPAVDIVKPYTEFSKAFKTATEKTAQHRNALHEWWKADDDKTWKAKAKARSDALKAIKNAKAKLATCRQKFNEFKKQNSEKIKSDPDFKQTVEEIENRFRDLGNRLDWQEKWVTEEDYGEIQV